MPQKILGIDLGSWSVKAVLLQTSFRGFEVTIVKEERLQPGEPATRLERQAEALKLLLADGTLRADAYVAGFPGDLTITRFVTLPFSDAKRVEQTLTGELADTLPFEISDAVYDHQIVKKLDDGGSLSLCSLAQKDVIEAVLGAVQGAGIDPRFLPIDVLQLFNLYSYFLRDDQSKAEAPTQAAAEANTFIMPSLDGPPDARMVIDIGHERTLVCAASPDGIAFARVIRAGGRDVTDAIAESYGIAWQDAEDGKHADALVTSARHPAPSDAAEKMSEVVAKGLQPLVKELRRTLQSIRSEKRVRVARIDLLGGGARIQNLANYLAEQLNVPVQKGAAVEQIVERHIEEPRRPAYASALAFALRTSGEQPVSRIDLRVDEFAYVGQLRHLRERAPFIASAAGLLLILLAANTWAQYHVVGKREVDIDKQFCEITQKVMGKTICEPTVALSVMKQPQSELGNFHLPERSAVRVAADLSNMIPKGSDVLIQDLEVTTERARLSGEATSFDAVDSIVNEFQKDPCFTDIKKPKLNKRSDGKGVEFQLTMRVGCS